MNIAHLFKSNVIDLATFHTALCEIAIGETLELPKGTRLYLAHDDSNETPYNADIEIHTINFCKPGTNTPADAEYGIVVDVEVEPRASFVSPSFGVLYKSRLCYMDAYVLLAQLIAQ